MSPRFVLSPEAQWDLDEILIYIFDHNGERLADIFAARFLETFGMLAENPGLGHLKEDITSLPVRFFTVWSYYVIYKPATNPLQIARIVHAKRDVESLLQDEPIE